jgi:hypothetical protein
MKMDIEKIKEMNIFSSQIQNRNVKILFEKGIFHLKKLSLKPFLMN